MTRILKKGRGPAGRKREAINNDEGGRSFLNQSKTNGWRNIGTKVESCSKLATLPQDVGITFIGWLSQAWREAWCKMGSFSLSSVAAGPG
jgi:hypothetical protein